MEHRLNAVGIYTPLQFLDADPVTLEKMVYKSVCGVEWHQRLRGWEVDKRDFPMRTAGRQYVLERINLNYQQVMQRLHNLCESVGYKVRSQGLQARGVSVHARSRSTGYWQARHMASMPFFSDQAIFSIAAQLFSNAPSDMKEIGVTCYELSEAGDVQLRLFGDELAREQKIVGAIDDINKRYGERTVHSASTLGTGMYVKQKIPFGSTRYL
jgi:nucleotidyltransferase/DNA polymerase involved in DNA repair